MHHGVNEKIEVIAYNLLDIGLQTIIFQSIIKKLQWGIEITRIDKN